MLDRRMYFCIRDDDTSFFTSPEELERVYGQISQLGPVSLAVVPFIGQELVKGFLNDTGDGGRCIPYTRTPR